MPGITERPGVALALRLWEAGYRITVSDPMALAAAGAMFGTKAAAASMADCAREADVLVITTPWPEYAGLDPGLLRRNGKRCVLIDCWRVLPRERFQDVAEMVYLGRGDDWNQVGGA